MSFMDQYAPSWWPAGCAPQDDDTLPPDYFLDPRRLTRWASDDDIFTPRNHMLSMDELNAMAPTAEQHGFS